MAMLRARGGRSLTTAPSSRISPDVGCSRPAIRRIKVVLLQPEGPSRTRNSPSLAMRSIPSTARTSSKCLEIRRASTVAMKGLGLVRDLRFSGANGARVDAGPPFFFNARSSGSDQVPILPLGPDRLHLGVGPLERVLGRLSTGRAFGEHGVEEPRLVRVGDRRGGVARIADVRRPIEHILKDGILVVRHRLRILGEELLKVRNGLGEAGKVVELARHERLLEVVDVIDQELLGARDVLRELPDHVAVHHVLEANAAHWALGSLSEPDLLVDRHLFFLATASDCYR